MDRLGLSSLPQFLVSPRFGAANMQIPCSFYFGSVFFAHTFRSSNLILPPSAPCLSPIPAHRILCFCFASAVPCFLPMSLRLFISAATSSLLCIAHFTFLLKGNATQRKARRGEAKRCKSDDRQKEQQAK